MEVFLDNEQTVMDFNRTTDPKATTWIQMKKAVSIPQDFLN